MRAMPTVTLTKVVYAVAIELPESVQTVPVDASGYALINTALEYTILPYVAGNPDALCR